MKVRAEAEHEARLAAERLGVPFLVYRDGEGRQQIHPLERGRRSVTIGRRDEADISLPWDPECSRLHAELELRAGEWTISDDGLSQNGTWINELRLAGRRRLNDGDDVRVGRTHLIFASPVVSLIIYALSAALIVVDFNYIRKHGTENDAIWLATGIFVSIVNIFVSLLNIFSGR